MPLPWAGHLQNPFLSGCGHILLQQSSPPQCGDPAYKPWPSDFQLFSVIYSLLHPREIWWGPAARQAPVPRKDTQALRIAAPCPQAAQAQEGRKREADPATQTDTVTEGVPGCSGWESREEGANLDCKVGAGGARKTPW